jgi:hypothetical protein
VPWSYSGNPASSNKDAVRFEIQDTESTAPLVQDAEVEYAIAQEGAATPAPRDLLSAAARLCEIIARKFSAQADTVIGSLEVTYSKQAAGYRAMAKDLRKRAQGSGLPFVGGQSISAKQALREEQDRVQPIFRRGQFREHHHQRDGEVGPPGGMDV